MPTHQPPPPPVRTAEKAPALESSAAGFAKAESELSRSTGIGSDYNRGPGTVWIPVVGAAVIGVVGFLVVHPFDLAIFNWLSSVGSRLGGDLRRELFAWQQYGQGLALLVTALLIWMLDPRHRRRLLDLGLAAAIAQIVSTGGKMLIGRPRPRPELMDPHSFPGPLGLYPIERGGHWLLVHGWDRAGGANADVWSMPSSHTLFAVMFSAFMATLYPRARWVFWTLGAMVGIDRVLFGAHWPSDVVVGAAAGYAIGAAVTRHGLGVRLLDKIWVRWVDPTAQPAWRGD